MVRNLSKIDRRGIAIPTALFLVLVMFTLATVIIKRTAQDMRFANLAADRTVRKYLARAAVATAMAKLNSGVNNEAEYFDSQIQEGVWLLPEPEVQDGHVLEVRIYRTDDADTTLRFEGRAYPQGHRELAEISNSTVIKQPVNDSVLMAKTPEVLGQSVPSLHYRTETDSQTGDWTTLPPVPAYHFPHLPPYNVPLTFLFPNFPQSHEPAPFPSWVTEPAFGVSDPNQMPAWVLTPQAMDLTGKVYVGLHSLHGILTGRQLIAMFDTAATPPEEEDLTQVSQNWKVLPSVPQLGISPDPFGWAGLIGHISVDGQGRVVVSRHNPGSNNILRFTPSGADPVPPSKVVPGEWELIGRPRTEEITYYSENYPPEAIPIQATLNPMMLTPVTDNRGNIYALWGAEPTSLFIEALSGGLEPDDESGELELHLGQRINTIYQLPAGTPSDDDTESAAWEPLPALPNLYFDDNHNVQQDGTAAQIGGLGVSPAGEVYALIVRDGTDSILKFAGGRWHLLPAAPSLDPTGQPPDDEEEFADFNNLTFDSRLRLYAKDPNIVGGAWDIDTIYRYRSGAFSTEQALRKPRLDYHLDPLGGMADPQPVHELAGGGRITDPGHYQFVPVASY